LKTLRCGAVRRAGEDCVTDVFLGCAAFIGAVAAVSIVRSVLIGWGRWRQGSATTVAIAIPLVLAMISVALALADEARMPGSGEVAQVAIVVFPLIAFVIGGVGTALSKFVLGEFSASRD
jgi:hypothetical protein